MFLKASTWALVAIVGWCCFAPLGVAQTLPESASPRSGIIVNSNSLQVNEGEVKEGEVVFAMPARYARTGRVTNTVTGRPSLNFYSGNSSIPAGTPVFSGRFEGVGEVWCAVHDWHEALRTVCFQTRSSGTAITLVGSAYTGFALERNSALEEAPEVIDDPSAVDDFPDMEMVYVFDRWRRAEVRLRKGLRVNGAIHWLETVAYDRAANGSTSFRMGQNVIRLSPTSESTLRAEILP